jgi:hypothetical protein
MLHFCRRIISSTIRNNLGLAKFLSPLRDWVHLAQRTHGLRRGLHSSAASRLAGMARLKRRPRALQACTWPVRSTSTTQGPKPSSVETLERGAEAPLFHISPLPGARFLLHISRSHVAPRAKDSRGGCPYMGVEDQTGKRRVVIHLRAIGETHGDLHAARDFFDRAFGQLAKPRVRWTQAAFAYSGDVFRLDGRGLGSRRAGGPGIGRVYISFSENLPHCSS